MSEETSPTLGLPYIQPSQAQKHVTHNEAVRMLDSLVQMSVLDRSLTTPPQEPSLADRYLVGAGAMGDWSGNDNALAVWEGSAWMFLTPQAGWSAYDIGAGATVVFDGTSWTTSTPEHIARLGVNATADDFNRLVVASDAILLNHNGHGHQLKINKAEAGDTGSLLFQTGYSGKAEMGLAGGDDFAINVSADGQNWHAAVQVHGATGITSTPNTPHFIARGVGEWTPIGAPEVDVILGDVDQGTGGAFDAATGRFTAPIAGLYVFGVNMFTRSPGAGRLALAVNHVTTSHAQPIFGGAPCSLIALVSLSAADIVSIRTADGDDTVEYLASSTTFSGWKVA